MQLGFRLKPSECKVLKAEAESLGLDLMSYLRMLITTHQSRNLKGRK